MSGLEVFALIEGISKTELADALHTLLITGAPRIPLAGKLWDWAELKGIYDELRQEINNSKPS